MLTKSLLFLPIIPIAMGGGDSDSVTSNSLFVWIGCAAFLMVSLNQAAVFWRNFITQNPASSEVANNLSHFEKTISTGIVDLEESLKGQLKKLEEEMDTRFKAASDSRKEMHQVNESLRTDITRCEVEVQCIKQQQALLAMKGNGR